ncbi:MAG: hypothetical protein ABI231_00830, partial [Candidatus Tumulicola sp.]
MRFSKIRTGAAAIAAAVALAACGGHGVVPSQSLASGVANGFTSNGFAPGVSPAKSPCAQPNMYYFQGSCAAFNMNMNATTTVVLGKVHPYQGIEITTTLSKFTKPPNVKSVPAIMGDAIGKDVTGKVKTKIFPLYGTGNNCFINQKPAKCPGKPFVYAELINMSKYTLKPQATPAFYIVDKNGYPGKTLCYAAILTQQGWVPNQAVGGKPNGDTLRIPSAPNPGQLIFPAN